MANDSMYPPWTMDGFCYVTPASERQQRHIDEDSHTSVHHSSYSTVRITVVLLTKVPLVAVTVIV